jgi:hypothetical protein
MFQLIRRSRSPPPGGGSFCDWYSRNVWSTYSWDLNGSMNFIIIYSRFPNTSSPFSTIFISNMDIIAPRYFTQRRHRASPLPRR